MRNVKCDFCKRKYNVTKLASCEVEICDRCILTINRKTWIMAYKYLNKARKEVREKEGV